MKNNNYLKKIIIKEKKLLPFCIALMAIVSLNIHSFAQIVLLSPTGDGGFENGTTFASNGWTTAFGANNIWYVGTVATSNGVRGAYVDKNATAGTVNTYANNAQTNYFYRSVTFPAGALNIVLSFKWRCEGEDGAGANQYDFARVYMVPTTTTPAAGTLLPAGNIIGPGKLNLQGTAFQSQSITLTGVAGTTQRFAFCWRNDGTVNNNPAGAFDEISITYYLPPSAASFTPSAGCAGSSITINGTNLGGATSVTIGGTPVSTITSNTATQIVAVVPGGTGGMVTVTTPGGSSTAPGIFTITPSPALFSVTGSGEYCPGGSGLPVGLSGSEGATVTYQLYNGATPIGSPVTGTGSAIAFGIQTAGTYTVIADNAVCIRHMAGSAIISISSLPAAPTNTSASPSTICPGASSNLKATSNAVIITQSGFAGFYNPANWTINNVPGGNVNTSGAPVSVSITSGNDGSGNPGNTAFNRGVVSASGTITFNWSYITPDDPAYDYPQYNIGGTVGLFPGFDQSGANNQSGTATLPITAGQNLVLRMRTEDGLLGAATVTITNFTGPALGGTINWYTVPSGGASIGSSSSDFNFSVSPPSNGANDYYAEAVNDAGCLSSSRTIVTVTVSVPNALAGSNSPVCIGNDINLSASGGTSYSWTGPNGFSSFFQNPNIASASGIHSGTYTVVVTDALSCTASTTTDVSVVSNPVLSIGSQTNVSCFGLFDGEIDADASGGTPQYLYSDGSTFNFDGIFMGLPAGTITINVTDDNQCEASIPVTITQPDELIASAGGSTSVCEGDPINLTSSATGGTQNYSYSWSGPNSFSSADQNPSIASATLADGGSYVVEITDAHACTDTETIIVAVHELPSVSDAGPDQFKCTSTATLAAVSPSVGTGAWTVVSGGGTVTSPGSPNSGVTGLTPGTNEFKWTVSNGVCTPEEDNVIIDVTPPTSSDAGADQSLCNATTGTLAANTPVNGSGVWTVLAGGSTVDVPTDPNSTVSNLTPGTNTFRWTITHLTCASANDADIKIRTAVPAQPVSISAPPSVCPPVTGVNISVPAAADADNYTWTVSPGTNGVTYQAPANQANVVADFATTTNSTYGIRVAAVNSCGAGNHIATIIRRSVSTPSAISGPSVACAGDSKTYSIGAVNGADNYTWGAPAGSTINGQPTPLITTATSVVVVFPGGFTTGNITVSSMVACFTSPQRTLLVKNSPNAPVSLSGTFKICPGSTGIAYSVPGVVGAASYNWTLPAGATLASGAGTNAITVNWPSNYNLNQNVCGYAVSSCGASSTGRCKSVSSIVPQTAGTMSGTATGACGETGNYSVGAVSNADVYTWTVPSGVAINSGQGSNTINVTYNGNVPSGNICVTTTNNSCAGNNAPRCKNVSTTPSNPGPITPQPSSFCAFDAGIEFSVAIVNGASGYQWTVPAGAVIQSGQGSNSIIVNWGANGGNVTVRAINACGNGGTRALNITLTCKTAPQSLTSDKPSFDLQVRPNPSHGEITVSFESSNTNPAWLIITDLSGREILKQLVDTKTGENQYEMDLSQLAKGIYLLNLRSQNNNGQLPIVIE